MIKSIKIDYLVKAEVFVIHCLLRHVAVPLFPQISSKMYETIRKTFDNAKKSSAIFG